MIILRIFDLCVRKLLMNNQIGTFHQLVLNAFKSIIVMDALDQLPYLLFFIKVFKYFLLIR
jgi:hypothetical protein